MVIFGKVTPRLVNEKIINCCLCNIWHISYGFIYTSQKPAPKIELPKKLSLKVEISIFFSRDLTTTYKGTGVIQVITAYRSQVLYQNNTIYD